MIEFFMPMQVPTATHQQKKVSTKSGKPIFYEDADLKSARAKFMAYLGKAVPNEKLTGPIRLTTWWLFETKSKKKEGTYKTTRPDTDNLIKLLKDCMTKLGYWEDDAQVASEVTEKYWAAEVPGIYVKIEVLGNESN